MKKSKFLLLVILILAFVILTKYNGASRNFFLDFINPIKVSYLKLTDISSSYLQQQENILKLEKENAKLNELLIEQSHYIEQLTKIYKLLPSLTKKPYKSIYLVDTISYIKLNRLNEIRLTTPKNLKLEDNKPYGLMQKDYVAGIVVSSYNKLNGYLLTNPKCNFSVVIGKDKVNGIAQGDNEKGMIVKFIPRWSKIKIGDVVKSSGLDNIFFPDIPVGEVTDIQTLDTYKVAKIKIYAKLQKPSVFFLVYDPRPYLTTDYMPKTSFPNKVYPFITVDSNDTNQINQSSQTKDSTIEPKKINEDDYIDLINSNLLWDNKFEFNKDINQR